MTTFLHISLVLRWSGIDISGFFITVLVLYRCPWYEPFYIYFTKKVKRTLSNRLKIKTIFFDIHPRFSSTALFNKLNVSDLLMLWIIQRKSTFLGLIIVIPLILTLNMSNHDISDHEKSCLIFKNIFI